VADVYRDSLGWDVGVEQIRELEANSGESLEAAVGRVARAGEALQGVILSQQNGSGC